MKAKHIIFPFLFIYFNVILLAMNSFILLHFSHKNKMYKIQFSEIFNFSYSSLPLASYHHQVDASTTFICSQRIHYFAYLQSSIFFTPRRDAESEGLNVFKDISWARLRCSAGMFMEIISIFLVVKLIVWMISLFINILFLNWDWDFSRGWWWEG